MPRAQRIRDPVLNLIEFGTDQFEHTLWQVIQTSPFQRLRRIRQLGFSEFVFPGATHTRFAHSLGVFHVARELMRIIERHVKAGGGQFREHQAQVALAAALLHDVGHGMFSHAFEAIGKEFSLPMAQHEHVSELLIRDSDIAGALNRELGSGFANDVATLIGQKEPGNLYDAVVSSQFDADRLDYMQRDRLMTGVRSSGVDPNWLMANLEVASVATGTDQTSSTEVETLVLGPKAAQTAESYVLALFHLYPNVYLHKTTRGAEILFGALIRRLLRLGDEWHTVKMGLPNNHPIRRFVDQRESLNHALALDDGVFWGALPMLAEADDWKVARLATCLLHRNLMRCHDLRLLVEAEMPRRADEPWADHQKRITLVCMNIEQTLKQRLENETGASGSILVDRYARTPYKRYGESDSPLNRILIRDATGKIKDMAELSPMIAAAEAFHIFRAYAFRDDTEAADAIVDIMRTKIAGAGHVGV
jgi:HD superfamily phosphohydrolase